MFSKEAKNSHTFIHEKTFTASARAGFFTILRTLNEAGKGCILLPSYIGLSKIEGSGVFDPVLKSKSAFEFYKLKSDLTIDMEDLSLKLKTRKFSSVLIIHYFGFFRNHYSEIRDLCKENNVILIEDCAHSLWGTFGSHHVGNWGDLSFSSIHKSLPTSAGGFLTAKNFSQIEFKVVEEDEIQKDDLAIFAKANAEEICKKRIENYNFIDSFFQRNRGFLNFFKPMYGSLLPGEIPLNYPILVSNNKREKLYFEMQSRGFTLIALYHTLIGQIPREEFATSFNTSGAILNLPVHQDIEISDLIEMIDALKKSLNLDGGNL